MLINLKGLLDQRKMNYRSFYSLIGISEKTGQNKLYEESDLTLGEARKIMTIFPEYTMEYLFASDGKRRKAAGSSESGEKTA